MKIKKLILFFYIILLGIGFTKREISLNNDRKLVESCFGKELCDGRIQALERLVKAKKSLKAYNLSNADLNYAYLANADLEEANLTNASLYRASLYNANLVSANLTNTDLRRADLRNANFTNADLINTDFFTVSISTYFTNANFTGANLRGVNLDRTEFKGANLTNAKLIDVDFRRADLSGANISGAYFVETKNITSGQLKNSCNWQLAIYKVRKDREKDDFVIDELANKEYVEKLKESNESYNFVRKRIPVDCSKWK